MRKRNSGHRAEEKDTQEFNQRIHEFAPQFAPLVLGAAERFARDDAARKAACGR
jgi:hypothetical protein